MNMYTLFEERSRGAGDFIVARDLTPLYRYADLEPLSARYARALSNLGVTPGDRVMVQVEKSPHCLFVYFEIPLLMTVRAVIHFL